MNDLQKKELQLLRCFTELCSQLGLRYYLACGTALGAVKYGGFIPWDDDVDVAMPREDYEQFLREAPGLLPERVFLQNYRSDPAFPQIFSKLRDSNTTYIEKTAAKLPINHGIYIDIFPLDGYPADKKLQRRLEARKKIYMHLLASAYAKPEGLREQIEYRLKRLLNIHNHTQQLAQRYDLLISQYPTEGSLVWCNHGSWQGVREYAPSEQYGCGVVGSFEGVSVQLPEKYFEYLMQKYGDYKQDPPPEQQIGHHNYTVCDCNRSYTEYI